MPNIGNYIITKTIGFEKFHKDNWLTLPMPQPKAN